MGGVEFSWRHDNYLHDGMPLRGIWGQRMDPMESHMTHVRTDIKRPLLRVLILHFFQT